MALSLQARVSSSSSSLSMMASNLRRARIKDSDSEDSDSSIGIIEEATGGLDSGSESELDRLLENESDIEVRTD